MKTIKSLFIKNLLNIIFIIAIVFLFVENIRLKSDIDSIKFEIEGGEHLPGFYGSGLQGRISESEDRISVLESRMEEINNSVDELTYKQRKPIHTLDIELSKEVSKKLREGNTE